MAKTNTIQKFITGEIIDADDMNQVLENVGAEGGSIPYDATSHNRDTDGNEDLGSVNYSWGDIYINQSKKIKSVNTGAASVVQEFTLAEIMQFIKKTDTPASYSGQGEKFVRVNSGETALEFTTSPNKSSMNHSFGWPILNARAGLIVGQSTLTGTISSTASYAYPGLAIVNTSYVTLYQFEWEKIAGITSVLVRAKIWQDSGTGSGQAGLQVDIGGQTNAALGTALQQTPEKVSFSVDVSALSDNTVYDVKVQLKTTDNVNTSYVYLGEISLIGQ